MPAAPGKPGFLMGLLWGIFLFFHGPATSKGSALPDFTPAPTVATGPPLKQPPAKATAANDVSRTVNSYLPEADMSVGYWYSRREENNYCIEFKGSRKSSNWSLSRCFNRGLFQKKENNVFLMTKETGTLQLTGNLDEEVGQGKYIFTEDTSFKKYLADHNITSSEKNLLFHLFFGDVNKEYVQFLKKQYRAVPGERLLELAIHGVTLERFKGFLTLFQKQGEGIPSIEQVVAARIHGLTEEYVQEFQRLGYMDLSLKKLTEAKIHGVNAAYVEGLNNAGFSKLPIDKVIAAKIHGVQPAAAKEMQALGTGEISLDKMIELQIHGVRPAYVSGLKSAGFEGLTIGQVMEAKIHGLDPTAVKELKALGYKDLTFRDMMNARVHGVNVAYVKDLQQAGFQNLTMDKTIEAKIHGVNGNFIKKAREQGYNLSSIDKYISLKIHGLAMESAKD